MVIDLMLVACSMLPRAATALTPMLFPATVASRATSCGSYPTLTAGCSCQLWQKGVADYALRCLAVHSLTAVVVSALNVLP